jgi:hypothetical protein
VTCRIVESVKSGHRFVGSHCIHLSFLYSDRTIQFSHGHRLHGTETLISFCLTVPPPSLSSISADHNHIRPVGTHPLRRIYYPDKSDYPSDQSPDYPMLPPIGFRTYTGAFPGYQLVSQNMTVEAKLTGAACDSGIPIPLPPIGIIPIAKFP